MAKTGSVMVAIKAKPNERGRRSHLPLQCTCKVEGAKCEEDFYVSYPKNIDNSHRPVKRMCEACFHGHTTAEATGTHAVLFKLMGLL